MPAAGDYPTCRAREIGAAAPGTFRAEGATLSPLPALSASALATGACSCHCSRVRFTLTVALLVISAAPLLAQQQESRAQQIMKIDPKLEYDLRRSAFHGGRSASSANSKAAHVKEFNFVQKSFGKEFNARTFGGTKEAQVGDRLFSTGKVHPKGKYEFPDATKQADTKAAPTRTAREADRALAVHTLRDGSRQFLGPESKKLNRAVTPEEAADWRKNGGQASAYSATSLEKYETLKPLSIDDIRELLNKNK